MLMEISFKFVEKKLLQYINMLIFWKFFKNTLLLVYKQYIEKQYKYKDHNKKYMLFLIQYEDKFLNLEICCIRS